MFSATDFTYDGVYSGLYGLRIATIDSSVVEETSYVTPTITTTKSALGKKFYFLDSVYEQQPTTEFSVISDSEIPDVLQRDILRWLDNRKGYKDLVINQPELHGYVYKCIFNVTGIIYHAGACIGFKLKAMFDSPYHYKQARLQTIESRGADYVRLVVYNDSDPVDEYIYPTITFTAQGYLDGETDGSNSESNGCAISIYNETDDPGKEREFKFVGTDLGDKITVDNELKMIISDKSGDLLSKFDGMNWLRLVKGMNILKIKINGTFSIKFLQYIKIRF